MKKKIISLILVIVCFISCVPIVSYAWNKNIFDTTFDFNYAYIELPGGKIIEGKVQSWRDFTDGDQLQIKINDVIYLTDTTRAVLIYDPYLK